MITGMMSADSIELQIRLSKLPPQQRGKVVQLFEGMKAGWCEEIRAKFCYWGELPHLLFGLWPADQHSQAVAKQCVAKWDSAVAVDQAKHSHRVTYRMMSLESGLPFGALVRNLANSGDVSQQLEVEILEMNMVATCEQRVEEIHARIFQLNASVGRNLEVASTSARVRLPEHFRILDDWRPYMFVVHNWCRRLTRELLEYPMGVEFCRCSLLNERIGAVYHCLPQQIFRNLNQDKVLHQGFKKADKVPEIKVSATLKLGLDYFKDRLRAGIVFSLPLEAIPPSLTVLPSERGNVDEGI
jgi:hypothetical protein